ncbi:hypothetical protein PYR71_13375 [Rhizobium sp. MC63]|uniref:Uncharacterized protein n=1 Tax=Rhizobium mulingense TaxID=3031128 RepID=A0ACC6N000_9HYPH|nr:MULTISPECIES: hypothetical protein [unclassified Rhizobium]MDF0697478.1 hypothetical protein [Rhizobium sp. MC63]MEA3518326.1 hypothetical protein [Rhizobium sp. MJ31]
MVELPILRLVDRALDWPRAIDLRPGAATRRAIRLEPHRGGRGHQELAFNRLALDEENRLVTLAIAQCSFARH